MQQKILNFSVDEQFIRAPHYRVVADSKDYLIGRFSFGETWQGLTKTAVFQGANGKAYHVLLVDDRCVVPHEVITPPFFFVSVFGGDRLTTDRATIEVAVSGLVPGQSPPAPTPDVYAQLIDQFTLERSATQAAAKTAAEKADLCVQAADSATLHADTARNAAILATAAAEQAVDLNQQVQSAAGDVFAAAATAGDFCELAQKAAEKVENQVVSHTFDPQSEQPQSGKAVTQALATIPTGGKPMRLIAKGTLTEAVKTIVVNKDSNGNDFQVTGEVDIYVDAPAVEKANSLFVGFDSGVATMGSYVTFVTGGLNTSPRCSMFHLWFNGGFWDSFTRVSADGGYYSGCYGIPNGRKVAKTASVNQIAIGGGSDLPVGTTYEIYGRDA